MFFSLVFEFKGLSAQVSDDAFSGLQGVLLLPWDVTVKTL